MAASRVRALDAGHTPIVVAADEKAGLRRAFRSMQKLPSPRNANRAPLRSARNGRGRRAAGCSSPRWVTRDVEGLADAGTGCTHPGIMRPFALLLLSSTRADDYRRHEEEAESECASGTSDSPDEDERGDHPSADSCPQVGHGYTISRTRARLTFRWCDTVSTN